MLALLKTKTTTSKNDTGFQYIFKISLSNTKRENSEPMDLKTTKSRKRIFKHAKVEYERERVKSDANLAAVTYCTQFYSSSDNLSNIIIL